MVLRIAFIAFLVVYFSILWVVFSPMYFRKNTAPAPQVAANPTEAPSPTPVAYKTPPETYTIPQAQFVSQSFNNCGPASLSMVLSMYGTNVSQEELRQKMRPFSNPLGGVDDKSIFAPEFVTHAENYGYKALHRPGGDITLIKTLVANDIPVILRTWLHPNEDIGHFRIVRGYDDTRQIFIQDDSYEGPNLTYDYDTFQAMWQPFNYGYILVYPEDKQDLVASILGEDMDEKTAYRNAIAVSEEELRENPNDSYAHFNLASAYYHLGEYEKSVAAFEEAQAGLPPRMLWYQLEPIYAYAKLGQSDTVFRLTDRILYNGNLAYSELYQVRGEIYLSQGNEGAARAEFEKAVYYNEHFQPAKDSLASL